MSGRGRIVGIDLGTTNSCLATYSEGGARLVATAAGQRTTPSTVAFLPDGRILVGTAARRQAVTNPRNTVTAVKRLIGRRFDSPEITVMRDVYPFEIARSPNGDAWVRAQDRLVSPSEIQSHVIEKLKDAAESELGESVNRAVITVPAYFDEAQRQATRDSTTIAGLQVVRILNEPTAAALAYGLHRSQGRRIAVVDLGGGTFDVTVLIVEDGVFEVLATAGDMLLGGEDFDRRIAMLLREEIHAAHGIDVFGDQVAMQRILEEAEAAKRALSESTEAILGLPFLAMSPNGQPVSVHRTLDRAEFDGITKDLVDRLIEPCRIALADAGLQANEIENVLLVGGMTRVPAVQTCFSRLFGVRPSKGVNPDEAVAIGAAVETAILEGTLTDVVLVDVVPHTIGIRAAGDRLAAVIKRSTPVPTRIRKVFATTEDDQSQVTVEVYQGENPVASKNRLLARLVLTDIPPGRKGEIHVEVTFSLDASGLLSIAAREMATGKPTTATVKPISGLDRNAVERLAAERQAAARKI
ncbi:MAG: Hsp70 family protein [Pseudomonadota bacterium]